MAQEVLEQKEIDALLNKIQQRNSDDANTENVVIEKPKPELKSLLICMYCGERIVIPYDKEEHRITGYMCIPRLWRGRQCRSDCGHAFVLPERIKNGEQRL